MSETSKSSKPDSSSLKIDKSQTVRSERAIELVRAEPPARTQHSDILIGEKEARRSRHRYSVPSEPFSPQDEPLVTKGRAWFSITINTSPDKPPLRIRLGKITGALLLISILAIVALATLTVINLVSGSSITANGDFLAWQNSAAVREQQRQQVIDLQERRLSDMQEENNKRLLEISELEGQLQDLSGSVNSLKEVARQLQDLLGLSAGAGNTNNNGQIPVVPAPTKGVGGDSSMYIPPIRVAGGYLDPNQGQQYISQFNGLLAKLDGLTQLVNNRKKTLTDYDIQITNYRQEIEQQKAQLDAASVNLSQLNTMSDGNGPPDILPWPGPITSTYGWRLSPFRPGVREFHYGLDIAVPEGTPVQAAKAGIVTYIGYDPGYGNMVEVTHAGGWLSRYGHNSRIVAKLGQTVKKGDIIALSGNTGASTGPHIHFEVHKDGVPVDPAQYIPSLKR